MPYFGQETVRAGAGEGPLTDAAYLEARATSARDSRGAEGIDAALQASTSSTRSSRRRMAPAWLTDPSTATTSPAQRYGAGGGRRLPEHHGADGRQPRPAGRHRRSWAGVERGDADRTRLRLRAGDARTPARRASSATVDSAGPAARRPADGSASMPGVVSRLCLRTISIAISSDCS